MDRIEKKIVLKASRARVWRALTQIAEFNSWFGVALAGEVEPGAKLRGPITTPGYTHLTMELTVERVDAEKLFSYRWHPYAIDPTIDYSGEPTTLVELRLDDAPEGTLLTVVESGFDAIPAARRAEAYRMNDGGWAAQLKSIAKHVAA
jgi:uncharacterized protein YndB with AHSA1/START domain